MAIKINNKDLYRRVINWQDVQRVILNWSQIRPTSQPHIDYHVISNRGTWWGGWGSWSWIPWWWGVWWSTAVGESGITNWWDTAGGSQWTADLQYNWLPSLLNAYKVEIIYSFYWNQTETYNYPFESFLEYNSSVTYESTINKLSQERLLWLRPFTQSWYILRDLSEWNYVMTAVLDLENESATLTLEWPNWFSQEIEASLTSTQIFNIRHSTDFWVILDDGVRLSRVDFYVYNNPPSQPVWAGVYHDATLWVISLSSDWTNWITIADKNLWATRVWDFGDALTADNCGGYFQWGNNYMFPFTWPVNTSNTQVDTTGYWPWNYYNDSNFVCGYNDWSNPRNANLWWGTTNTDIARRWPCESWFHVPSFQDWSSLMSILNWLSVEYEIRWYLLKCPPMWTWNYEYPPSHLDNSISLWTSTLYSADQQFWFCYTITPNFVWLWQASVGRPIRPFANTPVVPDSTRTVLYQPQ